jgi:predicted lipoprotein with Yx(FWY)xxD motif
MKHQMRWYAAAGLGGLTVLAACSSSAQSAGSTGSSTTVAVREVSGTGKVLVNSAGRTLYTSEQEAKNNKVLCTSSACVAIWAPVTAKGRPTGPADLSGDLSTIRRPDGTRQITFQGSPLYTFSFDHSVGDVKGNGQKDSFDGINFTWHAVTTSGSAGTSRSSASTPSYGSGGYGY